MLVTQIDQELEEHLVMVLQVVLQFFLLQVLVVAVADQLLQAVMEIQFHVLLVELVEQERISHLVFQEQQIQD